MFLCQLKLYLSFAKVSLDQTHPVTSVCLRLDCRRQLLSSPVNRITTGDAHFCTTSVAINQAALTSLTTAHSASGLTATHIFWQSLSPWWHFCPLSVHIHKVPFSEADARESYTVWFYSLIFSNELIYFCGFMEKFSCIVALPLRSVLHSFLEQLLKCIYSNNP